jgi:hypothetical protein
MYLIPVLGIDYRLSERQDGIARLAEENPV